MPSIEQMWTDKELEYLEDKWGITSVKTICKNLGRTEVAVIVKAKRLGLGSPYRSGEYITANQIAKMLKVDVHTVTDYWIAKCGLKGNKRAMRSQEMYLIKIENLKKWLELNQDKWDSKKLDSYELGEEPKWLQDKRFKDLNIPKRKFQKWTDAEDSQLISLYKLGFIQKEIAKRLNRSDNAIQRRVSRLKEKGLLYMKKIVCKWTEKEEVLFRELESKGLTDVAIAYELGREKEHITDHRRVLRKKGLYEGRKNISA